MKFINDWMILALAVGLVFGGLAAGRKMGAIAACWLAGGSWLAFRMADRLWRPAVNELMAANPGLDLETWLPASYGILFATMLVPIAVLILFMQPKRDVPLPGKTNESIGMAGGVAAGLVLLLALVQAQVMNADARERMPLTTGGAGPVLGVLGQQHVGVPTAKGGS
jgi:hypothetical protein